MFLHQNLLLLLLWWSMFFKPPVLLDVFFSFLFPSQQMLNRGCGDSLATKRCRKRKRYTEHSATFLRSQECALSDAAKKGGRFGQNAADRTPLCTFGIAVSKSQSSWLKLCGKQNQYCPSRCRRVHACAFCGVREQRHRRSHLAACL